MLRLRMPAERTDRLHVRCALSACWVLVFSEVDQTHKQHIKPRLSYWQLHRTCPSLPLRWTAPAGILSFQREQANALQPMCMCLTVYLTGRFTKWGLRRACSADRLAETPAPQTTSTCKGELWGATCIWGAACRRGTARALEHQDAMDAMSSGRQPSLGHRLKRPQHAPTEYARNQDL